MENILFVLGTLFSVIGFFGIFILNELKDSVKEAKTSIQELNKNVAVVINTIEYHEERIKKLEDSRDHH